MNASLLRILRIVIRADADPARQALFGNLMRSRRSVRLVYGIHERLGRGPAAALLVSGYGLAAFLGLAPPRNRRAQVVAVGGHENARYQVARILSWIGAADGDCVRSGRRALVRPAGLLESARLLSRGGLRASVRIIGAIDRRHGFLVACRAAAAIAWYARTLAILGARRPGAVLVSSNSNPEEVGFVGAARALDIPRVFVSHAYPTPYSPPLDFTLSILEGTAAVEAHRRKGPIRGDVLLAGIDGESAPLDVGRFGRPNPVIGIFTPKAISWPVLLGVIDDCRRHYQARQIVIRWHPSMLETPRLAGMLADRSAVIECPRPASLVEDARRCDWVIADENSNVHLPVLKLGIPTIAVRRLGLYPASRADLYGFIAAGVVFAAQGAVRDVDPHTLEAFFAGDWAERFRQYDAAYLRPTTVVCGEVRRAVLSLVTPPGATACPA